MAALNRLRKLSMKNIRFYTYIFEHRHNVWRDDWRSTLCLIYLLNRGFRYISTRNILRREFINSLEYLKKTSSTTKSANADCTARRVWNVKRASWLLGVVDFTTKFYVNEFMIHPFSKCCHRSIDS